MKFNKSHIYYYISVLLFLISLTQNAFFLDHEDGQQGYVILILGFYAVFDTGISWLANFLIIFSWIFRNKKASFYYSLSALVLGISFVFVDEVIKGTYNAYEKVTGYDIGYYLWLLSFLVMTAGSFIRFKNEWSRKVKI
ncbi:MAG: hypothetical protein HRU26_07205 [Psychroserpens sp.]|nr:hypothetical protein [Psychroserpens sp.]